MFKKLTSKGAALVEYGMLVGLIAVLAIVSVLNLGETVRNTFNQVSQTLSTSLASSTAAATTVLNSEGESLPSFVVAENAVAAWSFTAATSTYNGGTIGADVLHGPFGSISAYPGSPNPQQTNTYPDSDYIAFAFLDTDFEANDLNGMTLDCDFGTFSSLPASSTWEGSSRMWSLGSWSGHTMPVLVPGETYNCQIVP